MFKHRVNTDVLVTFRNIVAKYHDNRGPDAFSELALADNLYLFHNRLSIIDLAGGRQPMESEDAAITYNGEIYNYRELSRYVNKGDITSDTEVLLRGYEKGGDTFLQLTHSMFAFGIYKKREHELHLARDRVGIKPLYYYDDERIFAFASTLWPLVYFSSRAVDKQALAKYYINRSFAAPDTVFTDIKQIMPGGLLCVDTRKKQIVKKKAWWTPGDISQRTIKDENEALERIDELLRESIRNRLVSDVPVGLYLSGGVDSSTLVALASEEIPRISTFTASITGTDLDEAPFAKAVADRYQTTHFVMDLNPNEFVSALPEWIESQDCIVADQSTLVQYMLSKKVKEAGLRVMLSGEGSDEIFGGYNSYRRFLYKKKISSILQHVPRRDAIIRLLSRKHSRLRDLLNHFVSDYGFIGTAMLFPPHDIQELFNGSNATIDSATDFRGARLKDITDRVPNDLLCSADRTSMASSIETRVPFLAHTLIDLGLKLDDKLLIKGDQQKYIMKKYAEKYVPHNNIYRNKLGFDIPLASWLRHELKDSLVTSMESSHQGDVINLEMIKEIAEYHISGRVDAALKLWPYLCLEMNLKSLCAVPRVGRSLV